MLDRFFRDPEALRRLRSGCTGSFVDGFADHLAEAGYSLQTTRRYLRAAAHLGRWADASGLPLAEFAEAWRSRFARHLRACRRRKSHFRDIEAGADRFVEHLRRVGAISSLPAIAAGQRPAIVAALRSWMRAHRGVTTSTLDLYERKLRPFFAALGDDPSRYDVTGLRTFVLEHTAPLGRAAARGVVTALRSLLRYLAAEGRCRPGLDRAIPTPPEWRLSSLPRYLEADAVARVIASCDLSKPVGLRDRAVLLLLARLGLRAGDIVAMRPADIDWPRGTILVRGKGRREAVLPLPQDAGDALLAYLERGRPRVALDRIFLCARAPHRPFASSATVSDIVRFALRRAGIHDVPSRGAHLLRHSAATAMLRAGNSLETIATVLRHRSIQTTAHYAKVDVALLEGIAQPWPEGAPC